MTGYKVFIAKTALLSVWLLEDLTMVHMSTRAYSDGNRNKPATAISMCQFGLPLKPAEMGHFLKRKANLHTDASALCTVT